MQTDSISSSSFWDDLRFESDLHQRTSREHSRDDQGCDRDSEEPEQEIVLAIDCSQREEERDKYKEKPRRSQG